ncbi:hypothetical protein, partial [Lactiplantibacillus pentosus]|uniref:hypothetical protein n=1 Tax=Lactiplantibacillus pentosus TaxID=1589 RepID=UPI003C159412
RSSWLSLVWDWGDSAQGFKKDVSAIFADPSFLVCVVNKFLALRGGAGSDFCDRTTTPLLSAECQN